MDKEKIEQKAKELVDKFKGFAFYDWELPHNEAMKHQEQNAKQCAIISVKGEYHSLREQIVNLKSCRVIESEKTYLARLEMLIDEEKKVIKAIKEL